MTYTKEQLMNRQWVITEFAALKDMKNELYEKISSYNNSLSVPESLYGQMDAINEQIVELQDALDGIYGDDDYE